MVGTSRYVPRRLMSVPFLHAIDSLTTRSSGQINRFAIDAAA